MELSVRAVVENVDLVTEFVDEQLEGMGCSRRSMMQIDVALDELFSNVCNYAYGDEEGNVKVEVEWLEDKGSVSITLEDSGVPFDPLSVEEPDVTLGLFERSIGGLGIFMVRKSMDDVSYEYKDGHNRLTIVKAL